MINLRSDTVTSPIDAMRQAMAIAEIGDNVYDDNPTVAVLEADGARPAAKEAALPPQRHPGQFSGADDP